MKDDRDRRREVLWVVGAQAKRVEPSIGRQQRFLDASVLRNLRQVDLREERKFLLLERRRLYCWRKIRQSADAAGADLRLAGALLRLDEQDGRFRFAGAGFGDQAALDALLLVTLLLLLALLIPPTHLL